MSTTSNRRSHKQTNWKTQTIPSLWIIEILREKLFCELRRFSMRFHSWEFCRWCFFVFSFKFLHKQKYKHNSPGLTRFIAAHIWSMSNLGNAEKKKKRTKQSVERYVILPTVHHFNLILSIFWYIFSLWTSPSPMGKHSLRNGCDVLVLKIVKIVCARLLWHYTHGQKPRGCHSFEKHIWNLYLRWKLD